MRVLIFSFYTSIDDYDNFDYCWFWRLKNFDDFKDLEDVDEFDVYQV